MGRNKLSCTRLLIMLEQDPCCDMAIKQGQPVLHICLVPSAVCFPFVPPFLNFRSPLFPHPITPGHVCYPKLMGRCPRDGPVATFCLPLWTSNKLRPKRHVGMLMCAALGLPMEMPICSRSQLLREEKFELWLLDPVSLKGWLGGERPLQPGSALCLASVWLQVCS